jgi:hypothetical protein
LQSLAWLLGALACRAKIVSDDEALEQINGRLKQRNNFVVRSGAVHFLLSRRSMRENGAKGGQNSRKNLGKRRTKQLARKAAYARWRS